MRKVNYEDAPEWQPPEYAIPAEQDNSNDTEDGWQPPEYASPIKAEETEQPSALKRAWDWASSPLTEAPTKAAKAIADKIDQPSLKRSPTRARLEGFLAGITEGAGQFVSGLTSPLNIALTASGAAEAVPALSSGARVATKALSAPVIAEGAKHGYEGIKNRDFKEFITGVFEAAAGTAGALHGPHTATAEEPPVRQGREIPYRFTGEAPRAEAPVETPSAVKQPFTNPFEPEKPLPTRSPNLAAEYQTPEETTNKPIALSPDEVAYEKTKKRLNMGLEMPEEMLKKLKEEEPKQGFVNPFEEAKAEKPQAEFLALNEQGQPMYNIVEDGKRYTFTGPEELNKRGIEIPETPEDAVPMKGEEIRNRLLAAKAKSEPSFEELLNNYGGSGHPESPEYVGKVLSKAGTGEPGLAVENKDLYQHVVYRDKSGNPIAVAKLVTDPEGKLLVQDLATNKSKGLLTGRAMKAVGDKLVEMGATEPAGTMSEDAQNFLKRMKESATKSEPRRYPAEEPIDLGEAKNWTPPEYAKPSEEPQFSKVREFSPKLKDELEYRLDLAEDAAKEEGISFDRKNDSSIYQAMQDIENADSKDSPWMKEFGKEIRDWQIKKGVYKEITPKEMEGITVTSGKKYDFKHNGKYYVFDRHLTSEEPQAARTQSGKLVIGADIKSLGKVLGTSLYKGDIAPIATKELLQNSIDAVRHLGSEGKVDVVIDEHNSTIYVKDNGNGLTKDELESIFTDLGASGKREDASAAGGFGLAKAAPLLGGKKVEVSSVTRDANGVLHQHSFEGTPNQLLEGVDIKHKIMPEGTPTGTSVKVHVPPESSFYSANRFVEDLAKHSPDVQGQIRIAQNRYDREFNPEKLFRTVTKGENKSIVTLKGKSANVELSEPEGGQRRERGALQIHISNNGMYQTTRTKYFENPIPNVPEHLNVDIKSKVPEGHPDYPFTANREELRGTVEAQVEKYIEENIIKPGVGKRMDELKRLYNSMPEITVGKGEFPNTFGHKIALYDPKGQITPAEMKEITSNPSFQTLAGNIAGTLKEAMKVVDNPEWNNRLEKIGILFADNLHGIHIPNPGSGKSAILINPFISIGTMSPDEASANILHTILHEMAHVEKERPGHNEDFTIRLGDIYAKFGARRSVEAQDTILNSVADPNTGIYNPEIQKVLQTYKESRGREGTTEDLLSGTGVKSRTKGGGEGNLPGGNKPDGKRVTDAAVKKLFSALEEAKTSNEEQQAINKRERARRFASFASVKAEGAEGAAKSLSRLRGEFEKAEPGEALGLKPAEADALFTAVKRATITEPEKARGYTALFKLMNGESTPTRSELNVLDNVFGNGFGAKITELHGGIGAVGLKVSKLANTMKSLQNMLSLAAPLRHGAGMIARKEFYPAFRDMFKFFANKEFYDASMEAIHNDPKYLQSREAGLFIRKPGSVLESDEEFLNSYIGNIPGFTKIPAASAASQRAYNGFLNKLDFDVYKSMTKQAESLGVKMTEVVGEGDKAVTVPTKEAKAIARYINTATGRGDLGALNKMTTELNTLLWSPRMMASRIQMFTNPKIYTSLPKGMRLDGLKSLLGIAALGTTIDSLAALGGAKISTNILSSDFMKSRFGNKVIDPWAGFQQYVVAAARFLAGKTDAPTPTNRLNIAGRFLATKESPIVSLAHTLLTSKFTGKSDNPATAGNMTTQYGEKTNIYSQVGKQFVPIFVQDLNDLINSEPDFAHSIGLDTAMLGASAAGMSQDYPERKPLGFKKLR